MKLRPVSRRAGDAAALDEAAIQVEQQDRAEDGEDEAASGADQEPRDHAADQGAAETEAERRVPGHRVGPREREPREAADDEAPDDQAEEEEKHLRRSLRELRPHEED